MYDPRATGFITPKDLAFLIYELPPPLGRKGELDAHMLGADNLQADEVRRNAGGILNINLKFIKNDKKKDLIIPQGAVLETLRSLALPVYESQQVHFKDICIKLTKDAIIRQTGKNEFEKYACSSHLQDRRGTGRAPRARVEEEALSA